MHSYEVLGDDFVEHIRRTVVPLNVSNIAIGASPSRQVVVARLRVCVSMSVCMRRGVCMSVRVRVRVRRARGEVRRERLVLLAGARPQRARRLPQHPATQHRVTTHARTGHEHPRHRRDGTLTAW